MAKVILEQMLRERGLEGEITVDSAAKGITTRPGATYEARKVIRQLYQEDLLVNHKSKSINEMSLDDFHLILTMKERYKNGLPKDKTYTLSEYVGLKGDISDPYGQGLEVYRKCRDEIQNYLQQAIERIIEDC